MLPNKKQSLLPRKWPLTFTTVYIEQWSTVWKTLDVWLMLRHWLRIWAFNLILVKIKNLNSKGRRRRVRVLWAILRRKTARLLGWSSQSLRVGRRRFLTPRCRKQGWVKWAVILCLSQTRLNTSTWSYQRPCYRPLGLLKDSSLKPSSMNNMFSTRRTHQ